MILHRVNAYEEVVVEQGEFEDCKDQRVRAFVYGVKDRHMVLLSQDRRGDPCAEVEDMDNLLMAVGAAEEDISQALVEQTGMRRTRSDYQGH